MLRRSILQLASRGGSVSRVPLRTTTQIPSHLSSRRLFSTSPKGTHKPDSQNSGDEPKNRVLQFVNGGLALGSVVLIAYYYGALDSYVDKRSPNISEYAKTRLGYSNNIQASPEQPKADETHEISESIDRNSSLELDVSSSDTEHVKQDIETPGDVRIPVSFTTEEDKSIRANDMAFQTSDNVNTLEGTNVPNAPQSSISIGNVTIEPAEESVALHRSGAKPDEELVKAVECGPDVTAEDKTTADVEIKSLPNEQNTIQGLQEVAQGDMPQKADSLLDNYCLIGHDASSYEKPKDTSSRLEDVHDGYITKDGKLILDFLAFLQAINATKERQAELDARTYAEEKREIKEKYEKELKDARVRELMYAEREAILDKELTKERIKATVALKSLQEKLEEKLKIELEQKEMEVEQKLKKMVDIAKAEMAAAVASEKASQIEKMAEANLHINALCMAFYARSEEARQSHSVHKLALGALALEDALSKGLPVHKELEALHSHLGGIDKDSIVDLVLSSLPEDGKKYGMDTLSQLNHKFDALKGSLRHYSLIPAGEGGILSHSLAHFASWLKFKEVEQSGEGVESVIKRVERLLAEGKLCEAADTLENGLKGSQASQLANDWVRRARERAIADQAVTLLQSYATSVSLT